MVEIVGIHGIWNHRSMRANMHEAWLTAIKGGLENIRSLHAESVTLECAFYGHEYNDGKADSGPPYSMADLAQGFEEEFAEAMAASLLKDEFGTKGGGVR